MARLLGYGVVNPRTASTTHLGALYWYGLALAQQSTGKTPDALESVQKAIALGADGEEVSIEEFKAFYQALESLGFGDAVESVSPENTG